MTEPRQEILRLLAEGRVTPSEAEMLLDALEAGLAVRSDAKGVPGPGARASRPKRATSSPSAHQKALTPTRGRRRASKQTSSTGRHADSSRESAFPADGPSEAPTAAQKSSSRARRVWVLPPGSTLRIGPPKSGSEAPAGIGIRGVEGNRIQVHRGPGAELRAGEPGSYEFIWDEGILIMDIPATLVGLEIAGVNGKVVLLHYAGPFAIEGIAGSLAVRPVRSPFRIRKVGGDVELDSLSLQGGLSTIAEVGGDVRVKATRDASFSVRASSLSGQVALGRTIAVDSGDPARRRGVWRLGSGAGQLNITGVKGWIRLSQDSDAPEEA